jgi:hypothetical protein
MVDNQHRLIKGYRELSEAEIAAMNVAKQAEQEILTYIEEGLFDARVNPDKRWLAIAKTDLQKGFMALGRAIARPDGY